MLIFFFRSLQKCKQWMLQHLVRSPQRTTALGKYLVALANSQQQHSTGDSKQAAPPKSSAKRRRLHILYVLNDILFHVKNRTQSQAFLANIEQHLPALLKSAATFTNAPKHEKKLQALVDLWQQKGYFTESLLEKLRVAVNEGPKSTHSEANGGDVAQKATTVSSAAARDAPYTLPSMHGDASMPWYDLPAANWLPVIEPNSTRPMNPSMIRPLQLAGGPADKSLVQAVKKLLAEVDKVYAKEAHLNGDSPAVDISQMGEVIERDEMGDIVGGETYYGWSRAFCEKMKARRRKGDAMDVDEYRRGRAGSSRSDSRSRSGSRSRSRSRDRDRGRGRASSRSSSRPAIKRRRLSGSRSRSRSRSRQENSWSKSRSRRRSYSRRRSPSYSSRSRSRTRSPRRRGQNGHGQGSGSRGSYSPPRAIGSSSNIAPSGPSTNFIPPNPHQQFSLHPPPQPPPNFPGAPSFLPLPPQHLAPQPNFDGWNAPPPPPPPPHYQGHWPPPPPPGGPGAGGLPQPTAQGWFPPNTGSPPIPGPPAQGGWAGGWVPPPPPPPGPPQQQGGGYGYGHRGGGNGGYRARGGGYGRGRGW